MNIKVRLAILNFLEFAAWGAYLTSMGRYMGNIGLGTEIGYFYSMQGIASIFMPALMGIVADRWIPAQRLLGLCHLMAGAFMFLVAWYATTASPEVAFSTIFSLYACSVAFYMPTLALSYSVAYTALRKAGMDTIKDFPPIRVFGTVGFILTMWFVDIMGLQATQWQFATSGAVSLLLFAYSFSLPACPVAPKGSGKSLSEALGLRAFSLFKNKQMALFFFFSMLLGVNLQITNGYANPYISSFAAQPEFADTFGVRHANILISLSQISETCCILLIPFFMKRFGIKRVMLIAMTAWVARFLLFACGDPGNGVWMLVLSMIVYGVAFDFFNISGSLYVDQNTPADIRSSAQGLFTLVTNGIGATVGMVGAQMIINSFTYGMQIGDNIYTVGDWDTCWLIFSCYALVVAIFFHFAFHPASPGSQSTPTERKE